MSTMKSALFLWGGMDFHEPRQTSERFAERLKSRGYEVLLTNETSVLDSDLTRFDLIVICITMGEITDEQEANLLGAIRSGTGLAGWHGGLADAFRHRTEFQYAVGGQWVAHPGNEINYTVQIDRDNEITRGISDFAMTSEQYYMHLDPAVTVHASTMFSGEYDSWIDGVRMPVAWSKHYGQGRVYYCSLGHVNADFDCEPAALLVEQGLVWATR